MKTLILNLLCLVMFANQTVGQSQPTAKIYFYCLPSNSLIISQVPDKPIKIGKCTLLETNADSIGIELSRGKRVYLHFETGKNYYFHRIITGTNYVGATPVLSPSTEQAFWLNAYFSGMGTYRHYYLDKQSGLQLIEEKK